MERRRKGNELNGKNFFFFSKDEFCWCWRGDGLSITTQI